MDQERDEETDPLERDAVFPGDVPTHFPSHLAEKSSVWHNSLKYCIICTVAQVGSAV